MNGPVELLGVAASALLVAVAVAISAWAGLGLGRSLIEASVRALIQLALLGVVLTAIIAPGQPLALSWLWIAAMILFAGWTVQRRVPEVPGLGWLSIGAFTVAAVVTLGILSGKGRAIGAGAGYLYVDALQTDAEINPGNSGGPLIDEDGDVVGVVFAKVSGIETQGLGFAVPISTALDVLGVNSAPE